MKGKHGGKRKGAGRKASHPLRRKTMKITIDANIARFIQGQDEAPGRLIERAFVKAYGLEMLDENGLLPNGKRPPPLLN